VMIVMIVITVNGCIGTHRSCDLSSTG